MHLSKQYKISRQFQMLRQLCICSYIVGHFICLPIITGGAAYCIYRFINEQSMFHLIMLIVSITSLCVSLCNVLINIIIISIRIITLPMEFNLKINNEKYITKLPNNVKFKELSPNFG